MGNKKRKRHTPEFKATVGLEALRGSKTINPIGQEYAVHPVPMGRWKKEIQAQADTLFEGKRGPAPVAAQREPELLYSEIGKLKRELDGLKKSPGSACPDSPSVDRQRQRRDRGSAMRSGRRITRHGLCPATPQADG